MCVLTHLVYRMSVSDDEVEPGNPYLVFDNPGDIGCNRAFIEGKLLWTTAMTATQASDDKVMKACLSLMESHNDGDSLETRQELLAQVFIMQYNTAALGFWCKYFDVVPTSTKRIDLVAALVNGNIPFIPWDVFHMMLAGAKRDFANYDLDDLPAVDTTSLYETFSLAHPLGGITGPKKRGDAASTASSAANANTTTQQYATAFKKFTSQGSSELSERQRLQLSDSEANPDNSREAEQLLKKRAMATLHRKRAIDQADADFAKLMAEAEEPTAAPSKRQRTDEFDDDDHHPISGLLALDKFMKSMRNSIENSLYIDFASMSKDRLDQLQVLGVGSSSSKRLTSSTVLVTSATGADIKTFTYDFEAISSGFLYSYINLLSEASFPDAMARVKDRLAWWQWLTDFFGQNKPAIVKFIHAFMLKHHKAPFWMPVTEERCSMLAIQARDTCPMPFSPPSFHSGQGQPGARDKSSRGTRSKGPAKVFPGPGTVTVSGGITFTASQTAKLAQWRTRFAGFCQSRMTKDYTCNREKRGLSCKYKHECVWCHSASCKASCAQAEKF